MSIVSICFLSSMHTPRDKRVFEKEAIYLAMAGFDVTHLCPGRLEDAGVERGVRIVTYPPAKGILGRLGQMFRLFRLAKMQQADAYHCNEVDSWIIGVALRLLYGKRCVFDVHEHYPSTFAQSRFPNWMQPAVSAIIRYIFRMLTPFTDCLVLAKRSVAQDFCTLQYKLILVQNFTPLTALKFSDWQVQRKPDSRTTLVHLGLISKVRGWPQILNALAAMRNQDVLFRVIGEFNDGTRAEFEQRVSDLGLTERVKIYDWMPFSKAFAYLSESDIGIIAFQPDILNHVYAMPHKMFDYMAAGMAVVLPHFAWEVAPIVDESGCGVLIDPSDPNDIATKLDNLISIPGLIQEMGQRGRNAVREKYNWEAEVDRLISMYRTL